MQKPRQRVWLFCVTVRLCAVHVKLSATNRNLLFLKRIASFFFVIYFWKLLAIVIKRCQRIEFCARWSWCSALDDKEIFEYLAHHFAQTKCKQFSVWIELKHTHDIDIPATKWSRMIFSEMAVKQTERSTEQFLIKIGCDVGNSVKMIIWWVFMNAAFIIRSFKLSLCSSSIIQCSKKKESR